MLNESVKTGKLIVKYLIEKHNLQDNVLAVYTMGSFAENSVNKESDIDLNIFVKCSDYYNLYELKKAIKNTEKKFKRKIDTNIISEKEIKKGVVDSILFPHRYRHALLLFEIKYYNCLLYGKDILKSISIDYEKLPEEALKLLLTLGYRIRKIYLATGSFNEAKKQAIKFVTYACKFALIYKKIFIYGDDEVKKRFLQEFKGFEDLSIVSECFKLKKSKCNISKKVFERSINFIERLSSKLLEDYLKNKNEKNLLHSPSKKISTEN